MTKEIDKFFDLEDKSTDVLVVSPIIHHTDITKNVQDDYQQVREELKTMLTKGSGLVDKLITVAQESESPRAFEVAGGYLKQLAELGETLLKINKDADLIINTNKENNTNNEDTEEYAYVGSTEALQSYLNKNNKGK
jgi:hypothetical protein